MYETHVYYKIDSCYVIHVNTQYQYTMLRTMFPLLFFFLFPIFTHASHQCSYERKTGVLRKDLWSFGSAKRDARPTMQESFSQSRLRARNVTWTFFWKPFYAVLKTDDTILSMYTENRSSFDQHTHGVPEKDAPFVFALLLCFCSEPLSLALWHQITII